MKCAADFRRIARESLKGKWLLAVLMGLVASILGAYGSNDFLRIQTKRGVDSAQVGVDLVGIRIYSSEVIHADASMMESFLRSTVPVLLVIGLVVLVVQLILGSVVAAGYARFNLELVDGEEASANTLFAYFPQWKTMVIAGVLQTVYVLGWMLLFIIPGIIAAYRYAMTWYILAENPELTASEAIDLSKEMMKGNKWRLFCLQFSFIGWIILCAFTLGIGYLWLTPYEAAAYAAFYRDLTTPLAETEPDTPMAEVVS